MINDLQYVVLTVIDCNIETSAKELTSFLTDNNSNDKYVVAPVNKPSIENIYFPYPPKGANMDKILLWEPSNLVGQTAFFVNSYDGRHTIVLNYCKEFKRKAVKVSFSNCKELYPSFMFYYLDFSSNENIERVISLIKDGKKWEFYTSGKVQSFEESENYTNSRSVKKFNKEIILEYLLRLNIDICNNGFWTSLKNKHSYYITQTKW